MIAQRPRDPAPSRAPGVDLGAARAGQEWRTGDIALLVLVAVVLAVVAVLLAQGRVLLHPCVSAEGLTGGLGVRMSVLSSAADCPEGTLGFSPSAARGAVVMLSLAVPLLAAHIVLAVCGLGMTAVLVQVAVAAGRVVSAVVAPLPHQPGPLVAGRRWVVGGRQAMLSHEVTGRRSHRRRGPPLALA